MAKRQMKKQDAPAQDPQTATMATSEKTAAEQTAKPRTRKQAPSGTTADGAGSATSGPTHDQIAKRAYEIYQRRGGIHGLHNDDWLQAERELREATSKGGGARARKTKTTGQ